MQLFERDTAPQYTAVRKLKGKTSTHPFERKFDEMVKKAKAHTVRYSKPKVIPDHIKPKWCEEQRGWGMFNERLQIWVKEYGHEEHHVFKTEKLAQRWYRELI